VGEHRDQAALAAGLELDGALARREDRVVPADTGTRAWLELRTALAHDDLAARHGLAREHLDAEPLRLGVAAVAARSQSLFMCHLLLFLLCGGLTPGSRFLLARTVDFLDLDPR